MRCILLKKYFKIFLLVFFALLCSFKPIKSYAIEGSDISALKTSSNTVNCLSYLSNSNDSYTKNPIVPKYLYVISENDMTKAEQTMIATLQGLISAKSDHQIYILSSNEPDYKIWLEDLKDNYHVKYKNIKDPWKLLKKFKPYINGYILYNPLNPPSINNACTLASLKDSIVIDKTLESNVKNCGINNLIQDCSDTDKYWAYNTLWNLGLNHSTVIELSPDKSMALRDYAIMSKSLIFYEDEVAATTLRETIFKSMDDTSHCLGWGPDEHTNVDIASKFGVDVIAADWSYNLSVLSSYPSPSINPKTTNKEIPKEDNVHYVTFIMSDGDNQQWYLGSNYSSVKWYGSPYRDNLNIGWSISPSLYYLAPTVFDQYYKSASSSKYNNKFLVPPSGNGYMYPSKFPSDKLDAYTKILSDYMKEVNENSVIILDDNSFYRDDLWCKYTCHSNINGLFYLNYSRHDDYKGKIIWSNNKPIVSCRNLLWDGIEDEIQLVAAINNRIHLGYTDVKSPDSYTFVYVHAWSKTLDNVQDVITKLNENPKVRIVDPDTFIDLIQQNITPTT